MRHLTLLGVGLAILVGSCNSDSAAVACKEPPAAMLEIRPDVELAVKPNPVIAGTEATLMVEYEGQGEPYVGLATSWECWDGTDWVQTHQVVRADGDRQATTIDVSTASTVAIPAVGLPIPNSHSIIIPDVGPGIYRITDTVYNGPTELAAHGYVEVDA